MAHLARFQSIFSRFPELFIRLEESGKITQFDVKDDAGVIHNFKEFIGIQANSEASADLLPTLEYYIPLTIQTQKITTLNYHSKETGNHYTVNWIPLNKENLLVHVRNISNKEDISKK